MTNLIACLFLLLGSTDPGAAGGYGSPWAMRDLRIQHQICETEIPAGSFGKIKAFGLACFVMAMVAGCASLPKGFEQKSSRAVDGKLDTRLSRIYRPQVKARNGLSGLLLLPGGRKALAARATLAEMAVNSIDAQYYLLHNDLTGRIFIHELLQAADRGVRVRLLVDDIALWGRTKGAAALSSHPNVAVRIFNPFSRGGSRWAQMIYRFGSVTRRMHNKVFIADSQAAILGGRNIGNEYFEANPDIEFGDLDVLAIGPVVRSVSESFDAYWNSELAYPAEALRGKAGAHGRLEKIREDLDRYLKDQRESDYVKALSSEGFSQQIREGSLSFYWGNARVVYDPPEKILDPPTDASDILVADGLASLFDKAREEVIIYSPYFIPGKKGAEYLISLCNRGVRVRVLTNSLASTDVAVVHAGYSRYRKMLLRGGVEIWELDKVVSRKSRKAKKGDYASSKASLHTKSFVLDRKKVFIGSLNLDPRSFVENTEIGLVVDSEEIGQGMGVWFDQNVPAIAFKLHLRINENAPDQIRWTTRTGEVYLRDPHTSFFKRLGVSLLRLLPIESQL
jgi:putative cardiolipin synthase